MGWRRKSRFENASRMRQRCLDTKTQPWSHYNNDGRKPQRKVWKTKINYTSALGPDSAPVTMATWPSSTMQAPIVTGPSITVCVCVCDSFKEIVCLRCAQTIVHSGTKADWNKQPNSSCVSARSALPPDCWVQWEIASSLVWFWILKVWLSRDAAAEEKESPADQGRLQVLQNPVSAARWHKH